MLRRLLQSGSAARARHARGRRLSRYESSAGYEPLECRTLLAVDVVPSFTVTEDWGSGFQAQLKLQSRQTATITPNFTTSDAWLLTAKSAVVAPLSARFGIKVGYLVNFNNAPPLLPPVNGVAQTVRFKKFDGLLTTGVQFTY